MKKAKNRKSERGNEHDPEKGGKEMTAARWDSGSNTARDRHEKEAF